MQQITRRLALLLAATPALAQAAVSPADRAGLEGSSFTHFPLGRADARFQFLHGDLPGGRVIHGHAFRRDAQTVRGVVDGFVADLEVRVSTSPNTPGTASRTFAQNEGADVVTVLPRTTLSFPPTDRPALDPTPSFDLVVPYQLPFVMPAGSPTLCVDTTLFGNSSAGGNNRNLSLYLDAHELQTDGSNEQPGFRTGTGCAVPGASAASFATMALWTLGAGAGARIDLALRNGVVEDGSGLSRAFVSVGIANTPFPWPTRPECVLQTSADIWFPMPGTNTAAGSHDGSLTGLPILPPGYRLWLQAGSIHLGTGAFAFADASTVITPPPSASTLPAVRVAASTDRTATTGTISNSVPVTMFF